MRNHASVVAEQDIVADLDAPRLGAAVNDDARFEPAPGALPDLDPEVYDIHVVRRLGYGHRAEATSRLLKKGFYGRETTW